MAIRILLLAGLCAATANADIYRWDTGEVIPGTEGIEPGPGVQLDNVNLEYSDLSGRNLTGAQIWVSPIVTRIVLSVKCYRC